MNRIIANTPKTKTVVHKRQLLLISPHSSFSQEIDEQHTVDLASELAIATPKVCPDVADASHCHATRNRQAVGESEIRIMIVRIE
jgi:hypothetical protein